MAHGGAVHKMFRCTTRNKCMGASCNMHGGAIEDTGEGLMCRIAVQEMWYVLVQ